MYDFVTGDTGSKLQVTCKEASTGTAIVLSSATVRLKWISDGTVVSRTMTVTDATNGIAEYQFAADELEAPSMRFDVEITTASGVRTAADVVRVTVREEIAIGKNHVVRMLAGAAHFYGKSGTVTV